jgi:histidine triad (HIT) family protein
MVEDCVFCKIAKGEIPCHKIWEDEYFICFLDITQVSKGHILVVPKKHFENVSDCDDKILGKLNVICKNMGLLLKANLGASAFNILNASGKDAQQSVPHLHYHVISRYPEDGLDLWFHGNIDNKYDLKDIAKKLRGEN